MRTNLYPLQFEPIFKERIWGGTKLKSVLNKNITSDITGESWELSTVPGDVSIISNGFLKGKSLTDIVDEFPEEILGKSVYSKFGKQFPLLFKYLDARDDLSIQVHPNDLLAKKRHNSFGKTEMWYVLQADNNAELIIGFKEDSNAKDYLEHLKNNTLNDILKTEKVQKGDVYFLETGIIHAIGAGNLIAEIQQTSDITYRIYDFDRKDAMGNKRELHTELALEAINYNKSNAKKEYSALTNTPNEIVNCPYFTTNFLPISGEISVEKEGSSFTVYMCTEGAFEIQQQEQVFQFKKGDTLLIPAFFNQYKIRGNASLLEIYIS
jgi:mannose-6-phosphate isomerase